MNSRRTILKNIGMGTAVAALAAGATAVVTRSTGGAPSAASRMPEGAGPWWLVAPLARGSHLGAGWFLAHLSPVERGASVLTLQHREGTVARVHLCHHQGDPKGLAHSDLIDLVLMDGGRGDRATDESLGRVLMGLAAHIRDNELSADGDLGALARMQPHSDRVLDYGPENLT